MFNNYINIYDLRKLIEKINQGMWRQVYSKLTQGKRKGIKIHWDDVYKEIQNMPPINWWDMPAIKERWNYLISGDVSIDYFKHIVRRYFSDRDSLKALSLGCGDGQKEIKWADTGKFKIIDAFDLSENSIEYARVKARETGYDDIINYRVADIYGEKIWQERYDLILVDHSLHHFSPLRELLLKIKQSLNEDGYFIVNEFVGPTRFQWTDAQISITNGLLSILPTQKRMEWDRKCIKSEVYRPSRLSMILKDPSEAVESSNIMPLLRDLFNIVEERGYGGNILHLLFSGIAHHFLSEDAETERLIRFLFEAEDLFLENKDIQSDFVLAICRKT